MADEVGNTALDNEELEVAEVYVHNDPSMRPGLLTTEFWVTILVVASASVLVGLGHLEAENWQWAVGLSAGSYAISRGLAK